MKNLLILILSLSLFSNLLGQRNKKNELKLNHFYIVVDSLTFKNIKEYKKLQTWANLDQGLPGFKPIDSLSSTIYLRGKETYIEIMGPDNKFNEKIGATGIGFSWDSMSEKDTIFENRLKIKNKLEFNKHKTYKDLNNNKIDWYTAYYTKLNGQIATWFAFYNPEFLSHLNHKKHSSFKREYYLSKAYDKNKIITNILKIELNCSHEDYDKIIKELDCFFYGIKKGQRKCDYFLN